MQAEAEAAADWYDSQDEDNFTQAGNLFRIMSPEQQRQLFDNIGGGLAQATPSVQERMLAQFDHADPAYAEGVRAAMKRASS